MLTTGSELSRRLFGRVLSELRSLASIGRTAGAAVVGACTGGQELEVNQHPRQIHAAEASLRTTERRKVFWYDKSNLWRGIRIKSKSLEAGLCTAAAVQQSHPARGRCFQTFECESDREGHDPKICGLFLFYVHVMK